MRKAIVLIISFIFLVSSNIQASLFAPSFNPYSFGPQGRSVADLRDFAKPKQMANILAGRPVVATKQDGTRVYYSSDGKLCLSIKRNGEMSFSLGGHSLNLDKNGKLKSETKTLKGNFQEVRNEFGEITGYNQLDGSGSKVILSYDKDMNKIMSYDYGKYGKSLVSSLNLMNGQKTVYDKHERAMAVYSDDGYILTTYQYKDVSYDTDKDRRTLITTKAEGAIENGGIISSKSYHNKIVKSTDGSDGTDGETILDIMAHTTTYYDAEGLIMYVNNYEGVTTNIYYYKKDSVGNKVLEYVLDTTTKEKTYYVNNKQMYVENAEGAVITRYYWDGSRFLYSAQIGTDGNWITTTNNDDNDNITAFGNIVYNRDGTIDTIADDNGNIVERYFYKTDVDGNKILDYVKDVTNDTITYYDEDGCATKTVDPKGNIITDYGYNGSQKIYSFNRETGVTTWYVDGKDIVYESLYDRVISENIRVGGQLVGSWNLVQGADGDESYSLTIYVNENKRFQINYLKEIPSANLALFLMNEYIKTGSSSIDWLIANGYIKEDQLKKDDIVDTSVANSEE